MALYAEMWHAESYAFPGNVYSLFECGSSGGVVMVFALSPAVDRLPAHQVVLYASNWTSIRAPMLEIMENQDVQESETIVGKSS